METDLDVDVDGIVVDAGWIFDYNIRHGEGCVKLFRWKMKINYMKKCLVFRAFDEERKKVVQQKVAIHAVETIDFCSSMEGKIKFIRFHVSGFQPEKIRLEELKDYEWVIFLRIRPLTSLWIIFDDKRSYEKYKVYLLEVLKQNSIHMHAARASYCYRKPAPPRLATIFEENSE